MSTDLEEDEASAAVKSATNLEDAARDLMIKGRSINSGDTYNQEAFDLFSKAKELNPHLIEAWIELAKCHEQKEDIDSAIECLEIALTHCDPDKPDKVILRTLSALIRQRISKNCDSPGIKVEALLRSLELSKEALKSDLHDEENYYNLAKAYMCLFFVTECVDQQLINLSKAAFVKALNLSNESLSRRECTKDEEVTVLEQEKSNTNELEVNLSSLNNHPKPFIEQSDFLFNYSSVLIYLQEFQKALEYLRLAIKWDPDWEEPKSLEKCLVDYLRQVYLMVHELTKSNKRVVKRYCKVVDTLKNVERIEKIIEFDQRRLSKSQEIKVKPITLAELQSLQESHTGETKLQSDDTKPDRVKDNEVALLHLRLINTVNYNQAMYLTFVAIDRNYSLIVVTIYNLAESRCPTPKDLVTIVDPKIEQITVDNISTKEKDSTISFKRINVREFKSLYVNGCRITIDQVSKPQFRVSLLP